MTDVNAGRHSGLPAEVHRLLAAPPVTEKKLLELAVSWKALRARHAFLAERLRLFAITWDPLEHLPGRPDAFATVNVDPSDLELVVYVPIWSIVEQAAARDATIVVVLGEIAGSAVAAAARTGEGLVTGYGDLLSDRASGAALGPPDVRLVSPGWEDIGLGAITDVVQHAFGPVDLDRSLVELAATSRAKPDCPACAGRRFGFPADLAETVPLLCADHRREAETVIRTRLRRAEDSNPDGWRALGDAASRLELPHLPNGLAAKLAGAEQAVYEAPERDELAERARLVVEAASWFPGRPADLAVALGAEPGLAGFLPDWLESVVLDLGRAGLGDEALMVGEALARVDPDRAASRDADVAVALAEAGLAERARARVEFNLARWPDDFWVRLHAGDALAVLGDIDAATVHFEVALDMADDTDDFEARSYAVKRLQQVGRRTPRSTAGGRPGQNRRAAKGRGRSRRKRKR
jgi:hypothetical protein